MRTIKLMADYQCYPLWGVPPDELGDINPDTLPISQNLKMQLIKWAQTFDATLNMNDPASSGFLSDQEEVEFKKIGHELGERLQNELGSEFDVKVKI
jgi:hypothetical protein